MIAESSSAAIGLAVELAVKLRLALAHFAFHEIDDFFRLGDRVLFRQRADDGVGSVEQNNRGRDALAFGVRNDLRLAVGVDVRDRGKGGAEVDADCFAVGAGFSG